MLVRSSIAHIPPSLDSITSLIPVDTSTSRGLRGGLIERLENLYSLTSVPVMLRNIIETDESEKYAIWWHFHTDISVGEYPNYKGVKPTPYPLSKKEIAKKVSSRVRSQSCKSSLSIVKAIGITPHRHKRLPELVGSTVVHHSHVHFKAVVDSNADYVKDIVARYVDAREIGSSLLGPWREGDVLEITRPVKLTSHNKAAKFQGTHRSKEWWGTQEEILLLEDHLNKGRVLDIAAFEGVVSIREATQLNELTQAEAVVFDNPDHTPFDAFDKGKVTCNNTDDTARKVGSVDIDTSAANDDTPPWDVSDTSYEEDQMPMSIEDEYDMMTFDPNFWKGSSEAKRIISKLRENKLSRAWYEGNRYAKWLKDHNSFPHRLCVERARCNAFPMYEMQLGYEVSPVDQWHTAAAEGFIQRMYHRHLHHYDNETVGHTSARNWFRSMENKYPRPQYVHRFIADDTAIIDADTIESILEDRDQVLSEELIIKSLAKRRFQDWVCSTESPILAGVEAIDRICPPQISSRAPARSNLEWLREGKDYRQGVKDGDYGPVISEAYQRFRLWAREVETPCLTLTTTVDTTISQDSPTPQGAEVVSILDQRDKNKDGVKKLMSGLSIDFSGLTEEQKEGAYFTLTVINEALG